MTALWRSPRRRAGTSALRDRGSTTVEMTLWTAGLLLAITCAVQASVWGLAQLAARYAANHALQTTRVYGGTANSGTIDAAAVLNQIDPKLLTGTQIQVTRGAGTATVTITGNALRVLPLVTVPVRASVSAPVEEPGP